MITHNDVLDKNIFTHNMDAHAHTNCPM